MAWVILLWHKTWKGNGHHFGLTQCTATGFDKIGQTTGSGLPTAFRKKEKVIRSALSEQLILVKPIGQPVRQEKQGYYVVVRKPNNDVGRSGSGFFWPILPLEWVGDLGLDWLEGRKGVSYYHVLTQSTYFCWWLFFCWLAGSAALLTAISKNCSLSCKSCLGVKKCRLIDCMLPNLYLRKKSRHKPTDTHCAF